MSAANEEAASLSPLLGSASAEPAGPGLAVPELAATGARRRPRWRPGPLPGWRWRRPGTAGRLVTFQVVLLVVVLGVITFETEQVFTSHALATTQSSLAAEATDFTSAAAARPTTEGLATFTTSYLRTRVLAADEHVVVLFADRHQVGSAGSEALLASPELATLASAPPGGSSFLRWDVGGIPTEALVVPLRDGSRPAGTLVVTGGLARLVSDQSRVLWLAAGEALVAIAFASAGAYLLLRRLLGTVGSMTGRAAAIGGGDLDQRLDDPGTDDEVGLLARTLNWMLDRLSLALGAQRRLLSDVSHQLRTPLTVARGHLEVLARTGAGDPDEVRATVAVVVAELDHMRSLVERLLLLGRSLEPDFLDVSPVDLRSLVAELAQSARVLAERRWSTGVPPDVVIEVDEAKVRGALLNLVDNAVRATQPGDAVEVTAERRADGWLVLAVDDSGPGIPEVQRGAALARFGRPAGSPGEGTGLGLAIASAVAEAHGGTFELGRSYLGGCRAALVFPPGRVLASEQVVERL